MEITCLFVLINGLIKRVLKIQTSRFADIMIQTNYNMKTKKNQANTCEIITSHLCHNETHHSKTLWFPHILKTCLRLVLLMLFLLLLRLLRQVFPLDNKLCSYPSNCRADSTSKCHADSTLHHRFDQMIKWASVHEEPSQTFDNSTTIRLHNNNPNTQHEASTQH